MDSGSQPHTLTFVNEFGEKINLTLAWLPRPATPAPNPHHLVITMVGPNSTMENRITLTEAQWLHHSLEEFLGDGVPADSSDRVD